MHQLAEQMAYYRRPRTASPRMVSQEDPAAMPRWQIVPFRVPAGLSGAFFLSTQPQVISLWHRPTLSDMGRPAPLERRRVSKPPHAGLLLARTGPAPAGQRFPLDQAE